jgi:ketosteroid isomerase-like protein
MILRLALLLVALLLAPAGLRAQDLAVETARLEDLTSIREIKLLQARWGHLAMAGDWQGMAELGTQDVEMTLANGPARGREALAASLRERQGQGVDGMRAGRMNLPLYISPVITLDPGGQAATGRWHQVAMTAEVGGEAGWIGTTDIIRYRKTPEGWRISTIRPYLHFTGSYAEGWSHDAATLERAPYHYTADQAGSPLPERRSAAPVTREEIDRRATLLLRHSEAQNMVAAYGYYLDRAMYDDIADLFAEDALIEMGGQGSWRGKDGVAAFLTRFGAPGLDEGELNDRPQLMPMVTISADGASALVRNVEVGMTGQHGGEGYWSAAMQTFLLRMGEDGKWRIAMLHKSPIMRAEYKAGWANPLPAALPPGAGGEATGETRLGSVDFRENAYAVPPLGPDLITSVRGEPAPLATVPDALARAEAFDGAENVSNAYGYYIDQFAWRETADVFSRDGWKELSYIGTFIGKDRVLGSLIQRYGEGGPNDAMQAIHQKTQPYVTVLDDPTRAFVRTRLFQFNSSSTGPGSWISGIYENQIVKEDGIWRIHGMDLDYVWLGDYATGWTGIDPAASSRFGPSEEAIAAFAPDSPLRGETFAPFPRIAPMGFHFANPVSGREPATRLTWSDGRRVQATR